MAKAWEANRLSYPSLRLIPGGVRCPVEKIEFRLAERRSALALMRAGIVVLVLPLTILTVLLIGAIYYPFDHLLRLALPLLGLSAVLVALGIGLMARALRHLRWIDPRPAAVREKSDPPPMRQTRSR